jgi:hypothetical protein
MADVMKYLLFWIICAACVVMTLVAGPLIIWLYDKTGTVLHP